MTPRIGRRKPYTTRGISRIPCIRCGAPSAYQWAACSLDNRYAGVCAACDIALNAMVLRFFKIPNPGALIARYRARVNRQQARA